MQNYTFIPKLYKSYFVLRTMKNLQTHLIVALCIFLKYVFDFPIVYFRYCSTEGNYWLWNDTTMSTKNLKEINDRFIHYIIVIMKCLILMEFQCSTARKHVSNMKWWNYVSLTRFEGYGFTKLSLEGLSVYLVSLPVMVHINIVHLLKNVSDRRQQIYGVSVVIYGKETRSHVHIL